MCSSFLNSVLQEITFGSDLNKGLYTRLPGRDLLKVLRVCAPLPRVLSISDISLAPRSLFSFRFGSAWLGLACLGMARLAWAWLGLARSGSAWLGLARLASAWPGSLDKI